MSLVSTPRTWVAAEVVTAAEMNAEVRDAITGIEAAWTSYTPAWTATTTNPVLGNGTIIGKYRQINKTIQFYVQITMGSTTTFGSGAFLIALPVTEQSILWTFDGIARDLSATQNFPITGLDLTPGSPGSVQIACDPVTAGATLRSVSGTTPMAWAVGDILFVSGTYETT